MKSSDINCNQVIADAPVIQSNPIQSESESESSIAPDSAPTPKSPKPPATLQADMFGAICETCELNPRVNPGRIGKVASTLLSAGYTPEQVREFKPWWLSDAWRAEHTPVPSITKLTEQLEQFKNAASKPRVVPASNGYTNGNGRGAPVSKVDKTLANAAALREMLKEGGTL